MEKRIWGCNDHGGIVGLAQFVKDHRKAIEYDLLTKTGYQIRDIGRTLSWDALDSFLSNLRLDSALMREDDRKVSEWATTTKTNAILADIYDILARINANLVAIGSNKPAKEPKSYPRPNERPREDEKRIGSKGLPPAELRKWMKEKRVQHARNSSSDDYSHSSAGRSTGENNK